MVQVPGEKTSHCPLLAQFVHAQYLQRALLVHRILLVAVAIFSLYSVHLLLKTANEGGEFLQQYQLVLSHFCFHFDCSSFLLVVLQERWFTSSWATKPSGCRVKWPRPSPSPCRTSEVRNFIFFIQMFPVFFCDDANCVRWSLQPCPATSTSSSTSCPSSLKRLLEKEMGE